MIVSIIFQLYFSFLLHINLEEIINQVSTNDNYLLYLKILQIISSIAIFIIPVLLFHNFKSENFVEQTGLKRAPHLQMLTILILILISSGTVAGWLNEINQLIQLPELIQNWVLTKEKEAEELLKIFLQMKHPSDFLLNLIMIGVLPAIGEEFMFRGTLQALFNKWFKNEHWAIFITAIVFSAIHIQFMGFLPRFAMGVLFGYLYIWSNNLWYPIIAHFLYNSTQVILLYAFQLKIIATNIDNIEHIPLNILLLSIVILIFSSFLFYKNGKRLGKNF